MKEKRPLILITNDDGIKADGITKLVEALRSLGTIVVFAPDGPRSGMSCAITTTKPVLYEKVDSGENFVAFSCTGTPVDCVKLAINEVLPVKPDLLVSGINHGGNQGLSVHYSGTLGAAFEGCVFDVPSIGVSLCQFQSEVDFSESCRLGRILAEQVLKHGLPHGVYLNLNVPDNPTVKGIAVGRQSDGKWVREFLYDEIDGELNFWLSGEYESTGPSYPDNDIALLKDGYASLVPCKIDVTDYAFMETLKKWQLNACTDGAYPVSTEN